MEVMNEKPKKLYRSRSGAIAGVCQGLADYFNIDVVIVRIIALILLFCSCFTGFFVYLIMWIVTPLEPINNSYNRRQ